MPLISFIPERYEEGFRKIASMTEEQFNAFKEALSLTSLVSSTRALTYKLAENSALIEEDVSDIIESVGSLVTYTDDGEEVINEINEDIAAVSVEEKLIKKKDEKVFKERLSFLLHNQHLYYAAKAQVLTTEFENVYLSAKIMTDIRPIFGSKIEETPKGGIITHSLHVHYRAHREGNHKDIYLSLDNDDIESLIELLQRAQKKEKSLKHIFDKSNMTNLNE